MFKAKIIKVGTSAGLLVPKEVLRDKNLKIGEQVDVGFLKAQRLEAVRAALGIAKGAKPFKRDKTNRVDRY